MLQAVSLTPPRLRRILVPLVPRPSTGLSVHMPRCRRPQSRGRGEGQGAGAQAGATAGGGGPAAGAGAMGQEAGAGAGADVLGANRPTRHTGVRRTL